MTPPKLTEAIIRAGTQPQTFQRGQELYRDGAISDANLQGNLLTGDCEGTSAPYYRVRAVLDEAGIRETDCTCPYEYGGCCKHTVALLLTYLHHPSVLREEAAGLEVEIRKLRTGDRAASYEAEAPEAARLRRWLRAELGLSADEVVFLCTTLQVPDEAWQDAVEGVLGHNRFTLLVPPERYADAVGVYRERHRENLHGVGLIDSERIIRASHATPHRAKSSGPDSLAG